MTLLSTNCSQSVIYIPYQGPHKSPFCVSRLIYDIFTEENELDGEEYDPSPLTSYRPFQERDIPNGYELRMKVYRAAWTKCLDRVRVRALFRPPYCDSDLISTRTTGDHQGPPRTSCRRCGTTCAQRIQGHLTWSSILRNACHFCHW
jgi:hypothetical protein